jgi:hypothetical protein
MEAEFVVEAREINTAVLDAGFDVLVVDIKLAKRLDHACRRCAPWRKQEW